MSNDFIPRGDPEFDGFQQTFTAAVAANPTKYGLTPALVAALQSKQTAWTAAFPAHVHAETTSKAARATKDTARTEYEAELRSVTRLVSASKVTDADRITIGLRATTTIRTHIGAPTTRPILRPEATGHSRLTLFFTDEATPTKRAKPHGVHGCAIYSFVGDPSPADPSTWTHLALDTRTPYLDEHDPADAGKVVHYIGRWENAKGEHGPWSDAVATKVPV